MFNLMHLKFFFDAAKLKNVTAAAKKNFVSQSALSQGIQKLELDLGVSLTIHQKNRFQLTEEGKIVLEHAHKIFTDVDLMKEALFGETIQGTLTFACTNSLARAMVPSMLLKAKKEYPDLKVNFHRGSIRFITQALKEGMVDFAIALDSPFFASFDKEVIHKGHFQLYSTKTKAPVYVDHIDSVETQHFLPHIKTLGDELSGWGMVEQFIKEGLGAGILPDFMYSKEMKVIKTKAPPLPYDIVALFPKGGKLPKSAKALLFS